MLQHRTQCRNDNTQCRNDNTQCRNDNTQSRHTIKTLKGSPTEVAHDVGVRALPNAGPPSQLNVGIFEVSSWDNVSGFGHGVTTAVTAYVELHSAKGTGVRPFRPCLQHGDLPANVLQPLLILAGQGDHLDGHYAAAGPVPRLGQGGEGEGRRG